MRLEMRVAAARCDEGQRSEPVHSALHCRRCTWRATPPHHTARGTQRCCHSASLLHDEDRSGVYLYTRADGGVSRC